VFRSERRPRHALSGVQQRPQRQHRGLHHPRCRHRRAVQHLRRLVDPDHHVDVLKRRTPSGRTWRVPMWRRGRSTSPSSSPFTSAGHREQQVHPRDDPAPCDDAPRLGQGLAVVLRTRRPGLSL